MINTKELIGNKFGRLTVVEDLGIFVKEGTKTKLHWVKCKCDCGNEVIISSNNLVSGHTNSCGCYKLERIVDNKRKYNKYHIYDDIVFVKFSNCNEYFICDLEDWEKLKDLCWYKDINGYAATYLNRAPILMHRIVMNCPNGLVPDHINRIDGGVCDNRKSNLRIASRQQNSLNSKLFSHNTSGYRGISWDKNRSKWESKLGFHGKTIHLGRFDSIEDAIEARKQGELQYYGEYSSQYKDLAS